MASADVVSPAGPGGCPVVDGFDPMNPGQIDDPGPLTAIARREAPVFFAPAFDCYVVTRHADVARIMSDMRLFRGLSLTELEVPERAAHVLPQGFLGRRAGMLAWNDPDEHSRIRKLAQRAFTRKAALANEPRIRELFDATVDEFIADGEADLLPVFARRCPMRVMTAILGIDPAVEDRLHTWTRDTMRLMGDPTLDEAALVDLAHRQSDFERFVTDLIAERRAAPRPEGDLISDLLRSQDDEGGRGLDDEEIFATIALSIVAGGDTSVTSSASSSHGCSPTAATCGARSTPIAPASTWSSRRSCATRTSAGSRSGVPPRTWGSAASPSRRARSSLCTSGPPAVTTTSSRIPTASIPTAGTSSAISGSGCTGAPLARLETRCLLERLPNPRLVPGHHVRREISIAIPSLLDGLVVAWDAPRENSR